MVHINQIVIAKRSIKKAQIKGKRVLLRCDLNVPISNGKITDDSKIVASVPTIKYLFAKKAKQVILMSHLGRPKGPSYDLSLEPVKRRLEALIKRKIICLPSCSRGDFLAMQKKDQSNSCIMLENLRFNEGEERNDPMFAKELASFADVYVNDAFGTAHRGHASNEAVTRYLPSYIGLLMEEEIKQLSLISEKPKKPLVVILGFAKISDKLKTVQNLLKKADIVLVGGAVAFTFIEALGMNAGKSLVERDHIDIARELLDKYKKKIILPIDVIVARNLTIKVQHVVPVTHISPEYAGYDIGPETIKLFGKYILSAKTVFWNGPVGVFEIPPYDNATNKLAFILSKSKANTIIGGGDTVSAVIHSGLANKMSFLSTGGGASLEFLEGKPLPAIAAIYRQI